MDLTEAREAYGKGEITFKELYKIWNELANESEVFEFYNAPVYDRSLVVEGKTKAERDASWGQFLKSIPED